MCKDCRCGLPGEDPVGVSARHEDMPEHHHEHDHGHAHDHQHAPDDHLGHGHDHAHGHHHHDHSHPHSHDPNHDPQPGAAPARRTLELRQSILAQNDRLAERNRGFFHARGLLVLNLLSAPGSGKTTLLTKTLESLRDKLKAAVVVGDLATDNDAQRLRETGAPVVQITTGTVCHLEAAMVARAVNQLNLEGLQLLVIENVGNLVCPASYDLGEDLRVVLLAVTEGEDKPLKYPPIFQAVDVVIVTKTDLAPHCAFDRDLLLRNLRRVAPQARLFETSARTGAGLEAWREFVLDRFEQAKSREPLPL